MHSCLGKNDSASQALFDLAFAFAFDLAFALEVAFFIAKKFETSDPVRLNCNNQTRWFTDPQYYQDSQDLTTLTTITTTS